MLSVARVIGNIYLLETFYLPTLILLFLISMSFEFLGVYVEVAINIIAIVVQHLPFDALVFHFLAQSHSLSNELVLHGRSCKLILPLSRSSQIAFAAKKATDSTLLES